MSDNEDKKLEVCDNEVTTQETIDELSNNRGEDES